MFYKCCFVIVDFCCYDVLLCFCFAVFCLIRFRLCRLLAIFYAIQIQKKNKHINNNNNSTIPNVMHCLMCVNAHYPMCNVV